MESIALIVVAALMTRMKRVMVKVDGWMVRLLSNWTRLPPLSTT